MTTPDALTQRLDLDVRIQTEAIAIDVERRELTLRDIKSGETYKESYDDLVLSPGAKPLRSLEWPRPTGVFTIRNVPDALAVRACVDQRLATNDRPQAMRAVVVGGGFIGMEMAENLHHRGVDVQLVEGGLAGDAALDGDMAHLLQDKWNKPVSAYRSMPCLRRCAAPRMA